MTRILLVLMCCAAVWAQEAGPTTAREFQNRGVQRFMAGDFKGAIADWDKVIEMLPAQEAHHWQRGLAYYYAGEFRKGQKQFEMHRTVNADDVENAAWHYLCVARAETPAKARELLLPVGEDRRVPMTQILQLFAGKTTEAEVIKAAEAGNPRPDELKDRLCYAHLYLGLYAEAQGDKAAALKHIRKAAVDYAQEHYMGKVAQVHLRVLEPEKAKPAGDAKP